MAIYVTAQDLAPVTALLGPDLPELLREATEVLYLQLVEEEEASPDALRCTRLAQIALAQVVRLSEKIGGTQPYWPSARYFSLTARNREMCAEFKGDYTALSRKYKLSDMQVRNIVDLWQKEKFFARQSSLFESGSKSA